MKKNPLFKALLTLGVYALFLLIPASQKFFVGLIKGLTPNAFMVNALIYLLPVLVVLFFYGKEVLAEFSYFKSKFLQKVGQVFGLFLSIQVLNYLMNLLLAFLGPTNTANQEAVSQAAGQAPLYQTTLLFVILGPLVEEVVFRRILLKEGSRFLPEWLAIAISWFAFIFIHVHAPIDILTYMPVATVLTVAYLISKKNLAFSWSVHMLNNAFAVLLPIFLNSL